jgi:uncharacterized protein YqeY
MPLSEQILQDLQQAMKAGDKLRVSTLRLLRAAMKNREIARRRELDEAEALEVITLATKQRRETIQLAREHGREDIAQQEERELAILTAYLPAQLSLEDMQQCIETVVQEVGATSPKDIGRVMKAVMSTLKGRVDGNTVNRLVRERLEAQQTNGVLCDKDSR